MKTHIFEQNKNQFRRNISSQFDIRTAEMCMGPLNDDNKIQVDKCNISD